MPRLGEGFGVYLDPTKKTSGQRFFMQLGTALQGRSRSLASRPTAVLFNISAPWREILRAKGRGQRVVLRVDGLYSDMPTEAFLSRLSSPVAALLRACLRRPALRDRAADLANFLDSNYSAFLRICLADWVVYQSRFSHRVHQRYFKGKPSSIIVNGARWVTQRPKPSRKDGMPVRLVTTYDEWKPAKRIDEVLRFVEWLVEVRGMNVELTVLGYTGTIPSSYPEDARELLERRPYVKTVPRFTEYVGSVAEALLAADCYVSFSYRDPCPNAVVEAMAFGLPVLGVASGGLPDIVGDAGRLLPADDFSGGFFSAHRFENRFPPIDFEAMGRLLDEVLASLPELQARVQRRFIAELSVEAAADRYATVLDAVARLGRSPASATVGDGESGARP